MLCHYQFNLHLDTLLDFLEENHSLEHADQRIHFTQPSLRDPRRRTTIKNRLQSLSISSRFTEDVNVLISKIAVRKGAHLDVDFCERKAALEHIRSAVCMAHLSNLRSPTLMEYCPNQGTMKIIRLLGPNGSCSLRRFPMEVLFTEFPLLPLNDIRTFHLKHDASNLVQPVPSPQCTLPCPYLSSRHWS